MSNIHKEKLIDYESKPKNGILPNDGDEYEIDLRRISDVPSSII